MKPFFISILLFLLLGSCENRVEEKQYFTSEEPPATPLPDKAPPIPYVDILKLNYEDYINRYKDKHHPKSEVTFIINDLYDGIISKAQSHSGQIPIGQPAEVFLGVAGSARNTREGNVDDSYDCGNSEEA